ncbi:MAG: AzlD domain-containing protein [Syntrophaceae bacterium]
MDQITLVIIGMGIVTYATRSLMLSMNFKIAKNLELFLSFVPFSILSALIFPTLLVPGKDLDLSISNHHLLAGIVAIAVAYFSRKAVVTVIIGLAFMLLVKAITLNGIFF